MSLCGVLGVEDLELLARRGGRLEQSKQVRLEQEGVMCTVGSYMLNWDGWRRG